MASGNNLYSHENRCMHSTQNGEPHGDAYCDSTHGITLELELGVLKNMFLGGMGYGLQGG